MKKIIKTKQRQINNWKVLRTWHITKLSRKRAFCLIECIDCGSTEEIRRDYIKDKVCKKCKNTADNL